MKVTCTTKQNLTNEKGLRNKTNAVGEFQGEASTSEYHGTGGFKLRSEGGGRGEQKNRKLDSCTQGKAPLRSADDHGKGDSTVSLVKKSKRGGEEKISTAH